MGKGDLRSSRGKIFRGTYGNSRRRKKLKAKQRGGRARREGGATPPATAR
ncbi:MAG TPA: 30S ribosomal protein THX [Gemmatimonadales bacterium]|nr:30S ribosomal protein THX [Gemmatimonadales bacterium]